MAVRVSFRVPDPQNVIDTFGAGAFSRLERDTVATMATASEITTIAVVAGTTEHEYRDQTGVDGTHWYRLRYSTASPTLAAHYSGYGAVFQAGSPGGEVITLEQAKNWTSISDTTDDTWLPVAVGAVNRAVISGIGVDIGPSPDTTRYYDGTRARDGGRRLWVPGGIRAFLTVSVSVDAGVTYTAITADVRIGPRSSERPYGEPGSWIEFIHRPLGSYSTYPHGTDNVKVTATAFVGFGWDAYPMDLVQGASAALQRATKDRRGQGNFPTEADMLRYLNPALLRYYRDMYFTGVG